MAAPTAARLTRWAEGHHPDQTKLTDTTKPKGPVSLIVARLRRFNWKKYYFFDRPPGGSPI